MKLEIQPTSHANRNTVLKSRRADRVFANFTITDEHKKEIDFGRPNLSSAT
ncbi:transporter substrate-binding domain-containing protein [Paraburkholderia caledonica]|uniref:ABC-type amino acid transport substrate-binding protein n=1 Tax=Paraburkholderia caledonica TaxID=134536 RepID=A0AB73IM14_9BURK|nr:ABC-type amino acid transport substrate-binding protein [Paraburkholderia caledonica]